MQLLKRSYQKLPYAFFSLLWFWIGVAAILNGQLGGMFSLLVAAPFIYQWKYERKEVNMILGILTICWAIVISLAYVTDTVKITTFDAAAVRFISLGATLVILNFLMAALLIKKAIDKRVHAKAVA